MKHIAISCTDYIGYFDKTRHACRGIVKKDDKILLCYKANENEYVIPGGGLHVHETLEECCQREVKGETGIVCKPVTYYLEIEEFYKSKQHVNHYFICEFEKETNETKLSPIEREVDLKYKWVSIDQAIEIFSKYKFETTNIQKYSLYKRELTALQELIELTTK